MTNKRGTKYGLEPHAEAIVAAYVAGATAPELAQQYNVTRSAVHSFLGRHMGEIEELRAGVREALKASTIVHKVNRVAALERVFVGVLGTIEVRRRRHQKQYPDLEIGDFEVVDLKIDQQGGEHVIVRFDAPLSAQLQAAARAVAEEQGEIVRKSEAVVTGGKDAEGNDRPIPIVVHRPKSVEGAKPGDHAQP